MRRFTEITIRDIYKGVVSGITFLLAWGSLPFLMLWLGSSNTDISHKLSYAVSNNTPVSEVSEIMATYGINKIYCATKYKGADKEQEHPELVCMATGNGEHIKITATSDMPKGGAKIIESYDNAYNEDNAEYVDLNEYVKNNWWLGVNLKKNPIYIPLPYKYNTFVLTKSDGVLNFDVTVPLLKKVLNALSIHRKVLKLSRHDLAVASYDL